MANLLTDFLDRPGKPNYLALRTALIRSPEYDGASVLLTELEGLVAAGDHDVVRAMIPAVMVQFLLSPKAHFLLAASAAAAGDAAMKAREEAMAQACLHGIKATGDGSSEAPYHCVHAADEYDLARGLGLTVARQGHVLRDGRFLDVLTCTDGTELHFDVTETIAAMAKH